MGIPLTPGAPVIGKKFYQGRQNYVQDLRKKINEENQNVIYLLGPRRIGKTSIVKEYFKQQNENASDRGIYLYFYCAGIKSIFEFYDKINSQLVSELGKTSGINKFSLLTLRMSSWMSKFANVTRQTIKKINVEELGIELNDPDKRESYKKLVNTLKDEFINLLKKFEMERVVLGFDEVPEVIQAILKNDKRGAEEVNLWLEHFREIRQSESEENKVQMILFGSVNMKLSLEKLGMSNIVNDSNSIDVGPLSPEHVKGLFWELTEELAIKSFIENKAIVFQFLDDKFKHCSPWAIQNFVNEYLKLSTQSLEEGLKEAYLKLFDVTGGPRYFNERLSKYYDDMNIKKVKTIIKFIVTKQVRDNLFGIDMDVIYKNFKSEHESDWEEFRKVMDILILDNIVTRKKEQILILNTVEQNFWYERLVGDHKL